MKVEAWVRVALSLFSLSLWLIPVALPTSNGGVPPVSCGESITSDTLLTVDLVCPSDGLDISADNITLDCDGHSITGTLVGSIGILSRNRKNVTVTGCRVQNFYDGVVFDATTGGRILGNTANQNGLNGFYLESSTDITLSNNTAYDNIHGFRVYNSQSNTLLSNRSWNNSNYGFLLTYGSFNNLTLNIAEHNMISGFGLGQSSDYFLISNQAVHNQGSGFNLDMLNSSRVFSNKASNNTFGFALSQSFNNLLSRNQGISNSYAGFLLFPAANNTLELNQASQNSVGFHVQRSPNNTIVSNTVVSNELGIRLLNSTDNLVYNNHLDNIANALDDAANSWNISKTAGTNIVGRYFLGGNYWSDYRGQDLDEDGLGDTILPHNSTGGIEYGGDSHPLVPPSPDFNITTVSAMVTVKMGATEVLTVTLDAKNGFNGNVTVTSTTTPEPGLVVECTPVIVHLQTTGLLTCRLTLSAPGTYNVIVTGTSGSLSRTVTVSVLVEAASSPNPSPTLFGFQPSEVYAVAAVIVGVALATVGGGFVLRARSRGVIRTKS